MKNNKKKEKTTVKRKINIFYCIFIGNVKSSMHINQICTLKREHRNEIKNKLNKKKFNISKLD